MEISETIQKYTRLYPRNSRERICKPEHVQAIKSAF